MLERGNTRRIRAPGFAQRGRVRGAERREESRSERDQAGEQAGAEHGDGVRGDTEERRRAGRGLCAYIARASAMQ